MENFSAELLKLTDQLQMVNEDLKYRQQADDYDTKLLKQLIKKRDKLKYKINKLNNNSKKWL